MISVSLPKAPYTMKKRIYVFRHGQTDWNREHRFQGHTDVPLNATGRTEALRLIRPLETVGVQAILSSDLSRAVETGEIIARGLGGVPVFRDSRLREAHLGQAEGLVLDDVIATFGADLWERWKSGDPNELHLKFPGGETGHEVIARVFGAFEEFLSRHPFRAIGVATHGGVIRRTITRVFGGGAPNVLVPNGVLFGFEFHPESGEWEILHQTLLPAARKRP